MADDDDINIFEEFYDSIKPGGSFDQGALNIGKAVTDVLTPNEQTQAEMDAYEKQRQDALNFLYSASGVDPESFQGKALESQFRQNKELQKLLGFDSNMLKELKYDFAKAGQFLFGDANVGLTTMQKEGTKFKELPFNQKLGIAMLPIDALDIIGLGALAKGGISPLIKTGMKVYGKKSGKTIQDLLNDEQVLKAIEAEQPGFIQELDTTLGGGIIQKRFMTGKKKRGPTPKERDEGMTIFGGEDIRVPPAARAASDKERIGKLEEVADKSPDFINVFAGVDQKLLDEVEKAKQKKIKESESNLTKGGIEKKEGAGKGQNQNVKLVQNTLKQKRGEIYGVKTNKTLDDSQKEKINNILERIRTGEIDQTQGAKEAFEVAPGFGFYAPNKKKRNRLGVPGDNWGKIVKNYNAQFDDELFRNLADKYSRKNISEVNQVIKLANQLPKKSEAGNEIDFGMRFANAYKTFKLGEDFVIPKDGLGRGVFGSGNWKRIKELADEILKMQGSSETAFLKFPKNSYRTKDGTGLEYQTFGGDIGVNTLEEAFRIAGFNADQQVIVRNFKNSALEVAGKSTRDENYINQVSITSAINRFIKQGAARNASADEIIGVLNQVDAKAFGDVINKQRKLRNIFNKLKEQGIDDIEDFDLSHMEAVADNWKTALDANNLFFTTSSKNRGIQKEINSEISDVLKEIASLEKSKPRGAGVKIAKLKERFEELGKELSRLDLVSIVDGKKIGSTNIDYLSTAERLESDMLEKGFDEMTFPSDMEDLYTVDRKNKGGIVGDVDDIFEEEQQLREVPEQIKKLMPRITVEFGDAAKGTKRSFGEEKPEEDVFDIEQKTSAAPMTKTFDVQPTENIFTGEMEQANLKLPLWKLFTKPPVNETAPIPTPKENLDNPTKKQKQSLEQEKINKQDDVFDPTPEDNDKVNLVDDVTGMDIAVTPKTNQPITGVFYSDIERVLARPDTPEIFLNKKALLDFFRKNRIRDSEFRDYQIESLLRIYDENTPIPKQQVIDHLRQSPIRGMHVHATGRGSEIINPYGEKPTAYEGYAEPGYISGTQRERVLYIPNEKIPGDSGSYPVGIFPGESISNHAFGIPNQDDVYVVGWSRLTDRNAILPTKIAATKTQSKIPGLTRERERAQRQVAGLYAEAINKLNREGVRRGLPQGELDELSQLSLEQIMTQYGDTLNELSPGLLDQIDELIVKVRDIDDQITKGSNIDTSGIVRVAFADEIQSDIMQAAAGRKQKLVATLRKIQDEGKESTTLPQLSRIGNQALEFFEENKSVFRPLKRSQTEVDLIGEKLVKLDAEVDEIINRYIETRELDPASVTRLKEALTQNIDEMINELIVIDSKTYEGLFPDIPFKKREEWADALIKKDLFELAYRKFVLKEENVPEYYAVTPDQFVIDRYNFKGNSATPMDVRAADKKAQIDYFTARGEFKGSEYKGIGMSEFYGGPNAKTPDGKHYTSTIEKILKTQAKSNNSELVVLNVQTKAGAKDIFRITDQNGNMVATLSNRNQAETLINNNPNYRMERVSVPTDKNTTPSFAIKITEEMLEPYKTHKAKGGLVEMIDIFEVA